MTGIPVSGTPRDSRLDTLRGLFLVVMTVDHFSVFRSFAFGSFGYTSVAEGFVFLFGLVAGMVYGETARSDSFGAMRRKTRRRALVFYGTHLSLYIALLALSVTAAGWGAAFKRWAPLFGKDPVMSFILGAALLYQPTHLDILPMYVLFLALAPFAIRLCIEGKSRIVWAASLSVYVLAQWDIPMSLLFAVTEPLPVRVGFMDPFAWQLLFYAGLCFGVPDRGENPPIPNYRPLLLAGCALVAILMFACRHGFLELPWGSGRPDMFGRSELRPLRLLNFAAVAYLVSWGLSASGKNRGVPFLAFLGRHALPVFAYQMLMVYLLYPVLPEFARLAPFPKAFLSAGAAASLFVPAVLHRYYRRWVRKKAKGSG